MSELAGTPVRLRQAREAAGLHIAALAAALKVPVRKLEQLEAGRYDQLPDLTFARALASSVCRHLKVDPAPVLEEIPLPDEPHLSQFPKAISAPFRSPPPETGGASPGRGSRWAIVAGVVLVLAAAVLVFLPEPSTWTGWFQRSAGVTVTQQPEAAPAVVLESVSPSPVPPEAANPVETMVPADEVAQSQPAAPVIEAQETADTPAGQLLVLKARGDSWIEVVNGSGAVVVKRMISAGEVLDFSGAPPYSVVVGRADQVEVLVRGQVLDTTNLTRNSVARFEVK
ncbi:MAG: RodZ domain-containing protein [Gammaproteobacteria bacterium]